MVEVKMPQCCANIFFIIRFIRALNILFLFISALAMLLQNNAGITFGWYAGTYGAIIASFIFTVLLLLTAIALLLLHIIRKTLRYPRLLWVIALISLAVMTFIWFVVDAVYATYQGTQMGGLGASAAFKFFSTIVWIADAYVVYAIADNETTLLTDKIRESQSEHEHDPKKDKELFEKLKNVHSHWYVGAVRGLLGAVGNEIYRELPPVFQQELAACLSDIVDEDDLATGARCVSRAFDMQDMAKNGVHWVGAFGTKADKGGDSVKNMNQKSSHLHWTGEFGTANGEDTSTPTSGAQPKDSLQLPSFHLHQNAKEKLKKADQKPDKKLYGKKTERKIRSHQTENDGDLPNEQTWNSAFDEVQHLQNMNVVMRANANGAASAENGWPQSNVMSSSGRDVHDKIIDRSGVTEIIDYSRERFAHENAGAENDYFTNQAVMGDVAGLQKKSTIAPPTWFPIRSRKRLRSNRNSMQNGARNSPLNSGPESEIRHRQQTLIRMNNVKRLLKGKNNAWPNQRRHDSNPQQMNELQKASEQMWRDLIEKWKTSEEQREWMRNRQRSVTNAAELQNEARQSEALSSENNPQHFFNHPGTLSNRNVIVRADRQFTHAENPIAQHFNSENLNEKHQINALVSPLNLPNIFENGKKTSQHPSPALRSDGWTRRRRSFRIADADGDFNDVKVRYLKKMPALSEYQANTPAESPLTKISKFMTGMVRGKPELSGRDVTSWKSSYKRLWRLKEQLKSWKETQQRSQAYQQRRLLDMVTGTFKDSSADIPNNSVPDANGFNGIGDIPLVSEVTELANFLTHHNVTKSVKFLSPRLAPLLPRDEKAAGGNLLSPSLLAFYNDHSPNNIAPLPELLSAAGMNEDEKDAFLEFVMEVTGARDIVDKIFENLESAQGLGGLRQDILDANDQLVGVWKQFQSSYSDRQKDDIDTKGYAFLDSDQLDIFYGQEGYYNYTKPKLDLDNYYQLSEEERRGSLRATIRQLAGESPTEAAMRTWDRRLQQSVLTPNVGTATVLAPFTFGPSILSPAVLGPLVLSPNIFSPGILSPYLLSPPILSPSVGDPLILSPYVLGPNILSPSVLTPYVLSPYVLSPNILNPYVLSPLILSPYLLSPDILSPTVLSGTILSPYVLSPSILSDSVLAASVLSPSILSKK
uniref:MARVEL domain-containing protein n=1 Tax=Plectus sambesii TaxID=2011161 RepID=A0A914WFK8_9BILA